MIKTTCRLAITLGLIAVSVVWIAHGMRLIPEDTSEQVEARLQLSESLAVITSWFAQRDRHDGLDAMVQQVAGRSSPVRSVTILKNGSPIVEWGDHPDDWHSDESIPSTATRMSIDILANDVEWGQVQVSFSPVVESSVSTIWLILFCGSSLALLSWLFLNRSLKYLDPSNVVPSRVRNALDVMAEGLVLQDNKQQIVMANDAFAKIVAVPVDDLLGGSPDKFDWKHLNATDKPENSRPWQSALNDLEAQRGTILGLPDDQGSLRKFIVSSTPITEENGHCRGTLTSFEDVTDLEDKREELSRMLKILKASRDEIRRQNEHLQFLASRDSLTGCLNRRVFFDKLDELWAATENSAMSVIMLDIDLFKSINDNYGHSVGDTVIKQCAQRMRKVAGEMGELCRYGGEEFCIALPQVEFKDAIELAERIRMAVEMEPISDVDVTISLGVSGREFMAMDPQHMLEQADQSLYAAKNSGRNVVVGWDAHTSDSFSRQDEKVHTATHGDTAGFIDPVEHNAVLSGLYSALYYRDRKTALHCARVANLAVALAESHVDESVGEVLKVASLMHDIGKIGIPDSVLHKPSGLAAHEVNVMKRKDNIAEAICKSALVSPDVAAVITNYRRQFERGKGLEELNESQPRISIACRILFLCDAFDSMINETEYRRAISISAAIKELVRCSPNQFDPQLVSQLATLVTTRPEVLYPIKVAGALVDESLLNDSVDIVAAAQAGNLDRLRMMIKRLKCEALSEDEIFRQSIEQLENSLKQNDQELQRLFDSTQDLLDLCKVNQQRRVENGEYEPFAD